MREQDGLKRFKNNTFDWHSWAAEVIQTPAGLREAFDNLNLVGKSIVDMFSVGGSYELLKESFEELLYRQTKESGEAEKYGADPYFYYNPKFTITRGVQIDAPFIIVFDDGTRLEIDFSDYSTVALNTNCIPKDITSNTIERNFNCKKFFSPCIGKKLLGINIQAEPHAIYHDENAIDLFALLLEDGLRIHFNDWYDYGEVTLFDDNGNPIEITFREMEDCVEAMSELWMPHNEIRNVGTSLRSYGLGDILDDEKKCLDLIRTTCSRPTIFQGYTCRYLYHNYDIAEVAVTVMHEPHDYYMMGFNVHRVGNCFWHLRVGAQGKCNVDERNPYFFTVMFKDKEGEGTLPINIIHADVIPSFLEDDYILMQVGAFASSVEYNPTGVSESEVVTLGVTDCDNSQLARLRGPVLDVTKRSVNMIGHEAEFFDVTVQTPYGPIELVHILEKVKPEQRHLIKKGNFVDAVCVLSGDVAIGEYQQGAIRDEEDFLRLLRSCFDEGNFSRIEGVLSEKCEFIDEDGSGASEREQIVKYLNELYGKKRTKTRFTTFLDNGVSQRAIEIMAENPFILAIEVDNKEIISVKVHIELTLKPQHPYSKEQIRLLRIVGDALNHQEADESEFLKLVDDKFSYTSHMSGMSYSGKEAIIEHWAKIKAHYKGKEMPKYYYEIIEAATILRPCEHRPDIYSSEFCLRISFRKPDNLIAFGFIRTNTEGLISEIVLSRDSRYLFIDKMMKDSPQTVIPIEEREPVKGPSITFGDMITSIYGEEGAKRYFANQPQYLFDEDIFIWRRANKFAQKLLSDRGFFITHSEIEPDCVAYRCVRGEENFTVFLFAFGELKTAMLDGDYCVSLLDLPIARDSTVLVLQLNVTRKKGVDGKYTYRVANYAGKCGYYDLWMPDRIKGSNILVNFIEDWMSTRIMDFINAVNDRDIDALQAMITPAVFIEMSKGRFFNNAVYNCLASLRQEYNAMRVGFASFDGVIYHAVPSLEKFGFFLLSFDEQGKIDKIMEYPLHGEYKDWIVSMQEPTKTIFANVPDIVSAEMLPSEQTQRFAMKLKFSNGEVKKYVLPNDYMPESTPEPIKWIVFSDRVFMAGELVKHRNYLDFKKIGQGVEFPNGFSFGKVQLYHDSIPFYDGEIYDKVVFEDEYLCVRGKRLWRNGSLCFDKNQFHLDESTDLIRVLLPGSQAFNYRGWSTFAFLDGRRATNLEFNLMNESSNGLFLVNRAGYGYGYVDKYLNFIVPPQYSLASDFHGGNEYYYGFARVTLKESGYAKTFYICEDGKKLQTKRPNGSPTEYKRLGDFNEGMARVSTEDIRGVDLAFFSAHDDYAGVWGFINEDGIEVIPPQYIYAMDFDHGFAQVCKGKWTRDPKWDSEYKKGALWTEEELWGFIDRSGREVIPCCFDDVKRLPTNYDWGRGCSDYFAVQKNNVWGIMDKEGQWVVEPMFGDVYDDIANYCIAFSSKGNSLRDDESLMGIYDLANHRVLINPCSLETYFVNESMFWVRTMDAKDNEITIYGHNANVFKDYVPLASFANDYWERFFFVRFREEAGNVELRGVLKANGDVLLPCIRHINSPDDIDLKRRVFIFRENKKYGVITFDGVTVIPAQYDMIYEKKENGLFHVISGDSHGLIWFNGTCVLPCEYASLDIHKNTVIAGKAEGKYVLSIEIKKVPRQGDGD